MAGDALIANEARRLVGLGYVLVPCEPGRKKPARFEWNKPDNLVRDAAGAKEWFERRNSNLGIHLPSSGLCSVDIDAPEIAAALFLHMGLDLEQIMQVGSRVSSGGAKSRTLFKMPDGVTLPSLKYAIPAAAAVAVGFKANADNNGKVNVFELRGSAPNSQDMLPPSVHPNGDRYKGTTFPLKHRSEMPQPPDAILDMWSDWSAVRAKLDAYFGLAVPAGQQPAQSVQVGLVKAPEATVFDFSPLEAPLRPPEAQLEAVPPPPPVGSYADIARLYTQVNGNDIKGLLHDFGYEQKQPGRWLSPHSESGEPGIHLAKDGKHIFCYHGSDPLWGEFVDAAGTSQTQPRDFFDCYRILMHNGDKGAAIRAAKAEMGELLADADFNSCTSPGRLEEMRSALDESERWVAPVARASLKKPPLRVLFPDDVASLPKPQWLVKGWIPESGLGAIYGEPGAGKTFAVLDLALSIARGIDKWNDCGVRQAGVLYVAAEGGFGFQARQEAYKKHHDAQLSGVPFLLVPESVDLVAGASVDVPRILAACAQAPKGVGLIVLDTLSRVMAGANENASEDMGKLIAAAGQLTQATGAFVLIVTHVGKDATKGARGHSSLRGAVDTEIALTRHGDVRFIELRKQRDGADDLRAAFTLKPVVVSVEEDLEQVTAPVVVPCKLPAKTQGKAGRPSVWGELALECLEEAPGAALALDTLYARMGERYQAQQGGTLPARWLLSAKRAADSLLGEGVVVLEEGVARINLLEEEV